MENSNNIPVIWDERDKLLDSLFPKEVEDVRNKSYSSKHVSKTFDEISYEINYGENNSCGEYLDQWYSKGINANELLKYIYNKIPFGTSFFYPQMFITSTLNPMNQSSPLLFMGVTAYNAISSDKQNFRYDDVKRKTLNYGEVYVKLNMRACHVNLSEPGFRFKIDASKNEILFSASYIYQDAIDSGIRNFNNNTPETNDYDEIDKKYYAVILECKDPNSFMGLSYFIEHQSFIKASIIKAFSKAIKKATTKEELKFLYENVPDFALRELQFTEELLWIHLVELTNYDDVGVFSGWRDGSSAVINVLKAFGDSARLYETFKKNPAFIKRLYQNLDGKSVFDKQLISNRLIFSNLIIALCINNGFKGLQRIGKTFKYGKEYKFDGDVNQWITDEKQDEFFLQQLRNIPFLGADIIPIDDQIPEDNGAMYHPLDLVSIIDTDSKDKTPIIVPALYIKALSDEVELQEIETNIRIGLDVLAIVLGLVVVSTTANPTVLALACADIGLAAIDGGIQAYKTDILKFEGGAEFLQTWEKIYVVGGLALAGPALIQTVLTSGAKVMRLAQMAKNTNSVHFIESCLRKVLLKIENFPTFTKAQFEIIVDFTKEFGISSISNRIAKVFNEGVILIKGTQQESFVQEYFLLYKDKIISYGDLKEIYRDIEEILKLKGSLVIDKLYQFLSLLKKQKTLVNTSAKIGDEATEQTIKWGTVKMKLHPKFNDIIKFLKERNIDVKEIDDVTQDVGYTERFVYDKNGTTLLRVDKILEWHPEMRFLDLEHEIDHVLQLEKNLKSKSATVVSREVNGKILDLPPRKAVPLGKLNQAQMTFVEVENRIREINRLKSNNAPTKLIDEHISELEIWKKQFIQDLKNTSNTNSLKRWINEKFPNFDQDLLRLN